MDDYLQAEEAEERDDNNEDVDNDGEEHTNHQDDGAGKEGGEDRTRDAGDQDDGRQQQLCRASPTPAGGQLGLGHGGQR